MADKTWFANKTQLWLDLGDVKNLAEVILNGRIIGYRMEKTFPY